MNFNPGGFPAGTIQVTYQPPAVAAFAGRAAGQHIQSAAATSCLASTPAFRLALPTASALASSRSTLARDSARAVSITSVSIPDGSSKDSLGNYNSGVVYLTRPADTMYASRAISSLGSDRPHSRMASDSAGRRAHMDTTMKQNKIINSDARKSEGGFSLIEVMIAIVVMSIGLLAVIASFATAVRDQIGPGRSHRPPQGVRGNGEHLHGPQQPADSFRLCRQHRQRRDFPEWSQPLLCAGADGLVGHADDVVCTTQAGANCPNGGAECMVLPGPDGVLGNADDTT